MMAPAFRTEQKIDAQTIALLALVVYAFEEIFSSLVFLSMKRYPWLRGSLLLPVTAFITHWMLPIVMVLIVERRDLRALGFIVNRGRWGRYVFYALIGLVLPALVVGVDRALAIDFVEQVVQIGVAEEVFFRGYLLHRLAGWLGRRKGLVLGAFTFGFAHIASRVSQHGFGYPSHDLMLGFETFLGGMLIGSVYLRSKSIVPCTILHVSANLYLDRIFGIFNP